MKSKIVSPEVKALAILRGVATDQGWTCGVCGMTFDWNQEFNGHKGFEEIYDLGYVIAP